MNQIKEFSEVEFEKETLERFPNLKAILLSEEEVIVVRLTNLKKQKLKLAN